MLKFLHDSQFFFTTLNLLPSSPKISTVIFFYLYIFEALKEKREKEKLIIA